VVNITEFEIKLLNADANNIISFLPFGVTTVEFTMQGKVPSGYLQPVNSSLNSDSQTYVGYSDETKDFLLIWGAGKKEGQFISQDSVGKRSFLQLFHLRNNYDQGSITFGHSKKSSWLQKVNFFAASKEDVVRMQIEACEENRQITFLGSRIPMYYPRWFPPNPAKGEQIQYIDAQFPKISIEYLEDDFGIKSQQLSIFIENKNEKKIIATVQGDLICASPHAELFAFMPEKSLYVLRLWFYWVHERFQEDSFLSIEETATDEEAYNRSIAKRFICEIPDVERFDFIINTALNKIVWSGTDFHYQEHWGKIDDPIADAMIAGDIDLVIKTGEYFFGFDRKKPYYCPVDDLKKAAVENRSSQPNARIYMKEKDMYEVEVRGLNIKTHVPYVKNENSDKNLVSSVVSKME
jgi:hypothetical protein